MLTHTIMTVLQAKQIWPRCTKLSIFPIYVTSYLIQLMKVILEFVHKAGGSHFDTVLSKFSFHDMI